MATRSINTKLAIEGESEYRQAVQKINTELKTLDTQLGVVKSAYQNNQNSMEALQAKSEVLADKQKLLTDKVKECKEAYDNAKSTLDTYKSKNSELESALEKNKTAQSQLSDETKTAGTQWNNYKDQIANAESKLKDLENSTGDTSEEEKVLRDEIDQAKTAMENLNTSTGGMAETAGDLQAEEQRLTSDLEENNGQIDAAGRACEEWEQKQNRAQIQLNDTNAEIELNDQYLEEAANSADGCATSIDNFGKKTGDAGEKLNETNKSLDIMTAQMLQKELEKAFNALKDAIMACVDAAAEFEQQMSTVEAISGATSEEMNKLTNISKEMGSTTSFTATEAGEALEYMALAGWKTDDMLDALPDVLNLAAAADADLATTSDIVTDALTAFGYKASDASEFTDTLAAASSNSNTTVEQLGSAFQKVGPLAGTMGYSVEDVSEALGLMANSGLKAESAGTALNTMLTRMSGTNSSAKKQLEDLNVEMYNTDGTARPLADVISDLRTAFQNMGDDTNAATEAAYNLAGQRGMAGLLAIVQSSDEDFDKLADSIDNCNGAAADMAETKLDNYAGQVTLLESAWDGLKVEIGEQITPALGDLVEWLTGVVNSITDFISENPEVVAAISGIATTLGILTAALAALVAGMKIYNMVAKVVQKMNPFGWAMAVVTAVAALTAGIAAFVSVLNKNYNPGVEESKKRVDSLNESMEDLEKTAEETSDAIEENADSTDYLKNAISNLLEKEQLSEAEKQKMADYVAELNELYPDLGLSIDETTGSLDMETDAFKNLIDAAEDTSEITALAKEQEDAERAVAEAENDLTTAYDERDLVIAALNGDEEAYNKLQDEGSIKTGFLQSKTSALLKYENQLTKEIENGNDALDEAQDYYDECTEACEDLEKELSGLSDAEYDSYQKVGSKTEELCNDLMELQKNYEETQEAAKESADEQFSLFEKVEKEAKTSAKDIMEALESQQQYWAEYSNNLADLQSRNIEGLNELIEKFDDGSTQGAAMVASLADMTNEEIEGIVEEYGLVEDEENNWASQHADMVENYKEESQEIIDEFTDWVNQQENLTEQDRQYMLDYINTFHEDASELDEEYEGDLEKLSDEQKQYMTEALEGLKGTSTEMVTDTDQQLSDLERSIKTTSSNLVDDLSELCTAYDDVYQACYDSMEGQFGLWDEAEQIQAEGIDTLIKNQETQQQYWANFTENLENLYGRDIDGLEEFVNAHSDGTEENVKLIAALAQAEDDEVAHYLETIGATEEGVQDASKIVADHSTSMSDSIDDFITTWMDDVDLLDLSDESRENAIQTLVGMIKGMEDESGEVYSNAEDMGNTVESKIREKLNSDNGADIASDFGEGVEKGLEADEGKVDEASEKFASGVYSVSSDILNEDTGKEMGSDFGEGAAEGIDSETGSVTNAAEGAKEAVYEGWDADTTEKDLYNSGREMFSSFEEGVDSKKSDIILKMKNTAQVAVNQFKNQMQPNDFNVTAQNLIVGFINGLNTKSGNLYTSMENLAKNALNQFNNTLGVHSPSDETEWSAEKTIEGWVVGIDENTDKAEKSMAELAEESLAAFTEKYNTSIDSMVETSQTAETAINSFAENMNDSFGTVDGYTKALSLTVDNFNETINTMEENLEQVVYAENSFAVSTKSDFNTADVSTESLRKTLSNFDSQLLATIKDVKNYANTTALYASGQNTIQGFIDGVNNKSSNLYTTMVNLAQTSLNKFNDTLGIHSPSKKSYESATNTILGWIDGIADGTSSMEQAMQSLAESAMSAFNAGLYSGTEDASMKTLYTSIESAISSGFEPGSSEMLALKKNANEVMKEVQASLTAGLLDGSVSKSEVNAFNIFYADLMDAFDNGFSNTSMAKLQEDANSVSGIFESMGWSAEQTIAGYTSEIESQTSALSSSMSSAAQTALDSFNNTLGIHSPSEEAEESAKNTIKGWIVGIEENTSDLDNSMANLATEAMDCFNSELDSGLEKAASLDVLSAGVNISGADIDQNATIYITMPIYNNGQYTKSEIIKFVMDGINHKQINNYAAKGVTL